MYSNYNSKQPNETVEITIESYVVSIKILLLSVYGKFCLEFCCVINIMTPPQIFGNFELLTSQVYRYWGKYIKNMITG